jgi:hypothetical protein
MFKLQPGSLVFNSDVGYTLINECVWTEDSVHSGFPVHILEGIPLEDREKGIPWIRLIPHTAWESIDELDESYNLVVEANTVYLNDWILERSSICGQMSNCEMTTILRQLHDTMFGEREEFIPSEEYQKMMEHDRAVRLGMFNRN